MNRTLQDQIARFGCLGLLLVVGACQSPKEPANEKQIRWSQYSLVMYSSNLMMDMPEVIRVKTGMEGKCYSPGYMHYWFTSLIDKDTIQLHVQTSLEMVDCSLYSSSRKLEDMAHYFREQHPASTVLYKRTHFLERDPLYYVKFSENEKIYYMIYLCREGGFVKMSLENLKNERTFEHMLLSIGFENRKRFMCW